MAINERQKILEKMGKRYQRDSQTHRSKVENKVTTPWLKRRRQTDRQKYTIKNKEI